MSVESYEEQILKAVEIIADKKVSDLSFDKTITGIVETVVLDSNNVNTGEYKVKYQDSILTAYVPLNDQLYVAGDLVSVKIPLGDFSNRNIITGYAKKVNTSLALETANSKTAVYKSEASFTTNDSIALLSDGLYYEGQGMNQGDMWIVTNFPYLTGDGWKTYTWTGSSWSTPDSRRSVDGGIITTNSLHARSIVSDSITAEKINVGDRAVTLKGTFYPNRAAANETVVLGKLYFGGGSLAINGVAAALTCAAQIVVNVTTAATYWIYAIIPGTTSDNVFTPTGTCTLSYYTTGSLPEDGSTTKYISIGSWTVTAAGQAGTLAINTGQSKINPGEIQSGIINASVEMTSPIIRSSKNNIDSTSTGFWLSSTGLNIGTSTNYLKYKVGANPALSVVGGAISGGTINGVTITGGTVQTAAPGTARVVLSGTVHEPGYGYCWVNFETEAYSGFTRGAARIAGSSELLEPGVVAGQLYLSSPQYNGSPVASILLSTSSGGLAGSGIMLSSPGGGVTVYPKSTNDYLNSAFIGTDDDYHTMLKLGNATYPGKPAEASGGGVTLKGLHASKVLQVRNYNDSLYGDVHADTLVALSKLRTDDLLQMKETRGSGTALRDLYLWTDGTTWQLRFYVGDVLKKLTFTN